MSSKYCSLTPLLNFYQYPRPINWDHEFVNQSRTVVEIGFGLGEVLVKAAVENPHTGYIGLEQNWERIYKTLKSITDENRGLENDKNIQNIRIMRIDAHVAFEQLFQEESINYIYSLFPCPWPKKSHAKHRLFNNRFLKIINNRLIEKGELKIVTDHFPYVEWLREQLPGTGFSAETETISPQFNTKFERKWTGEGQEQFFETRLSKQEHIYLKTQGDVELKSYSLTEFHPDKFQIPLTINEEIVYSDKKERLTLIFKDKIFDPKKQLCIIEFLISEEHLTQPFRVVIKKRIKDWCLCKADNQSFLPTPGIVKTLQIIYNLARKSIS